MTPAVTQGEYLVKVTVRNNLILRRMKELGIKTQEDLAQLSGVSQPKVSAFIGMRRRPTDRVTGEWTDMAYLLSAALRAEPEDLWTEKQRGLALERSSREVSMSEDAVMQLASGLGPEHQVQQVLTSERLNAALDTLNPQEREVIQARFFQDETYREIGERLGISHTRAQQLAERGLCRMRHPAKELKPYLKDHNT